MIFAFICTVLQSCRFFAFFNRYFLLKWVYSPKINLFSNSFSLKFNTCKCSFFCLNLLFSFCYDISFYSSDPVVCLLVRTCAIKRSLTFEGKKLNKCFYEADEERKRNSLREFETAMEMSVFRYFFQYNCNVQNYHSNMVGSLLTFRNEKYLMVY